MSFAKANDSLLWKLVTLAHAKEEPFKKGSKPKEAMSQNCLGNVFRKFERVAMQITPCALRGRRRWAIPTSHQKAFVQCFANIEAFSTSFFFFWLFTVEPKTCPKAKNRGASFWSCNCWFGFNGLIENSPNYQSSSPNNGQEGRWIRLLYFFIDEREARNSTVFCDVSYIFFSSSWLEIRRYFFQHKWTVVHSSR